SPRAGRAATSCTNETRVPAEALPAGRIAARNPPNACHDAQSQTATGESRITERRPRAATLETDGVTFAQYLGCDRAGVPHPFTDVGGCEPPADRQRRSLLLPMQRVSCFGLSVRT